MLTRQDITQALRIRAVRLKYELERSQLSPARRRLITQELQEIQAQLSQEDWLNALPVPLKIVGHAPDWQNTKAA